MNNAIEAGAKEISPVKDHGYGYRQGEIEDPFGHHWLIQKKISQVHSRIKQTPLQKALHFFVTKMVIGIGVIVLLVAVIEWLRSSILDKTNLSNDLKALMVAVADAFIATTGYVFLFRMYDKRPIHELSAPTFFNNATVGFLTGITLQSLFILVIYLTGTFLIVNINPVSTLIGPFALL